MKFFRRTAGYTFIYHKRNERHFRKVEQVDEKHRRYKSNWPRHVRRMDNNRAKNILNYRPNERRLLGRPSKILRRGCNRFIRA
jgi:hypothetical protein